MIGKDPKFGKQVKTLIDKGKLGELHRQFQRKTRPDVSPGRNDRAIPKRKKKSMRFSTGVEIRVSFRDGGRRLRGISEHMGAMAISLNSGKLANGRRGALIWEGA